MSQIIDAIRRFKEIGGVDAAKSAIDLVEKVMNKEITVGEGFSRLADIMGSEEAKGMIGAVAKLKDATVSTPESQAAEPKPPVVKIDAELKQVQVYFDAIMRATGHEEDSPTLDRVIENTSALIDQLMMILTKFVVSSRITRKTWDDLRKSYNDIFSGDRRSWKREVALQRLSAKQGSIWVILAGSQLSS